jgi:hypothetical protein
LLSETLGHAGEPTGLVLFSCRGRPGELLLHE